jgi:hypothetical protein
VCGAWGCVECARVCMCVSVFAFLCQASMRGGKGAFAGATSLGRPPFWLTLTCAVAVLSRFLLTSLTHLMMKGVGVANLHHYTCRRILSKVVTRNGAKGEVS